MILHGFEVADGHQVPNRLCRRLPDLRFDEVLDDGERHLGSLREPREERTASPP